MPALQSGRLIYTNIPLHIDVILNDFPIANSTVHQFTNDQVNGDFLMSIPGGAIIIIDECWRYWPSGMKSNEMPLQDKEFFAEHRHKAGQDNLTQEIVLVCQSPSQLAKCVKDLIDKTIMTVKADKIGLDNKYQVQIFSACIPSIDRPGEPNMTGMGTYKPEVFKYYKSHTKSETGLPGIEIKSDKRGSIWSHWYIRYLAPLVLISAIWGAWYVTKFFSGDTFGTKPPPEASATSSPAVETKPVQNPVNQPPPPPISEDSKRFRVAGTLYREGRFYVLVHDAQAKHMVYLPPDKCDLTGLNGPECKINNQIVTKYTGQQVMPKKDPGLLDVVPEVTTN